MLWFDFIHTPPFFIYMKFTAQDLGNYFLFIWLADGPNPRWVPHLN